MLDIGLGIKPPMIHSELLDFMRTFSVRLLNTVINVKKNLNIFLFCAGTYDTQHSRRKLINILRKEIIAKQLLNSNLTQV